MITPLVLLLSLAAHPPNVQEDLRIDLAFGGHALSPRVRTYAVAEASRIWRRYGVELRLPDRANTVPSSAARLVVLVSDHRDSPGQRDVLGSIVVDHGSPVAVVRVYLDGALDIMSSSRFPAWALDEKSPMYSVLLGRVLGRALAHEIGHYLLRLPHSPAGLMRATHQAADLVDPDDRAFSLSDLELTRLRSVLSASR